jgi:hypothetical protein
VSSEAIRGGSEIIRGFANGQAGGRIAGRVEELKRRTPLSIRPEVRLESAYRLDFNPYAPDLAGRQLRTAFAVAFRTTAIDAFVRIERAFCLRRIVFLFALLCADFITGLPDPRKAKNWPSLREAVTANFRVIGPTDIRALT